MNLYVFSKISQRTTSIFHVIARDENRARELLKQDGHELAPDSNFYGLETFYCNLEEHEECIAFSLEVGE